MYKPRHTQKEWIIEGNEIMADNWRMIVTLPDDWAYLNEEDKANARLIVYAPKLLKALKGLVSRATYSEEKTSVFIKAKAVITKVEGGTK